MSDDRLTAIDLFCGGGGFSTALALACEELEHDPRLIAVNHWTKAIETHKRNHPWAEHHNAKVEELHPPAIVGDDDVDLLVGGPECTHFSTARGGKPVSEQKRASPWHMVDWIEKTEPTAFLVENVPELQSWGPVDEDGQPTRNGETFEAWVTVLHSLGYSVDWDVLNAADYGDATTRKRLFVVGRRQHRAAFPEPTHAKDGADGLEPWRPAAEIVDWSDPGESIWQRDRPLVNNTMQRIAEGIRRHGSEGLERFADALDSLGAQRDLDDGKNVTLTATLQENAVDAGDVEMAVEARDEPFLVKYYGTAMSCPTDEPMDTITSGGNKFALAVPYLLRQQSGGVPSSPEEPLPTIASRGAIAKVVSETFVLPRNGARRGLHSNTTYDPGERPLHTVTAKNHDGHLVTPYLVPYYGEREGQRPRTHAIDDPLPTVTATGSDPYLATPFLVEYYGNGSAVDVDDPLPTVTTRDRFALVVPELWPWGLDIRYRMLQPPELAAAMGFPSDYSFAGNKGETTEQIGNAVPVNLAKALIHKLLTGEEPSLATFTPGEVPADD